MCRGDVGCAGGCKVCRKGVGYAGGVCEVSKEGVGCAEGMWGV